MWLRKMFNKEYPVKFYRSLAYVITGHIHNLRFSLRKAIQSIILSWATIFLYFIYFLFHYWAFQKKNGWKKAMKNIDNGKTRQEKKGIFNKGKEMKREQFLFSFFSFFFGMQTIKQLTHHNPDLQDSFRCRKWMQKMFSTKNSQNIKLFSFFFLSHY